MNERTTAMPEESKFIIKSNAYFIIKTLIVDPILQKMI